MTVPRSTPARVLLLAAEASLARLLPRLEQGGLNVATHTSADTALRQLERDLPDAVVLDARLPGLELLRVVGMLHDREGGARVSAVVINHAGEVGEGEGATAYLGPSAGPDDVLRVLSDRLPGAVTPPARPTARPADAPPAPPASPAPVPAVRPPEPSRVAPPERPAVASPAPAPPAPEAPPNRLEQPRRVGPPPSRPPVEVPRRPTGVAPRGPSGWVVLILLVYLVAIVGAEIAAAVTNPRLGLGAHALILGALLLHAALVAPGRPRAMVLAIALVPILRMVSLALPLVGLPLVWWYALITVIAAVAVAIAARAAGFSSRELGLEAPRRSLPLALLMVPLGLGLGLLEYMILRPQPWVRSPALAELWLPALLLIIGSGLMELVFRGLLQAAAVALLGRAGGIAYVAVLFTGLYAGYFWWAVLLFILPVALLLGVLAWRSRSILPSTLAHAAMNVMVFLIAPLVLPNPPTLGALRLPSVAELRPPVLFRVPSVMAATAAQQVVATPTPTGPRLPGGPADAAPSDGRPVGGPFGPISPRVGPTPLPTPPTPPPATPQPTPIPPATSTPIPTSTPTEVPPSPTSTPTSTAVGQPTATSPTPEATPTPAVATATPTPEPSPQPPATPVIADATPTPTTLVATPTASTPTATPEVGNGRHENGAGQAGLPRSGAGGVELPTLVVRGTEGIGARLRSSPGLDAPILSLLEESAIVTVAGPDQLVDDLVWQYVRLADGQEGWIATILLAPESPRAREVR